MPSLPRPCPRFLRTKAAAVEAGVKRGPSPSLEAAPDAAKPPAKKARTQQASGGTGPDLVRLTGKPDPSFKEQPYFFLDGANDDVQNAIKFFKLRDFPADGLYVRNTNGDAIRSVYHASDLVKVRRALLIGLPQRAHC